MYHKFKVHKRIAFKLWYNATTKQCCLIHAPVLFDSRTVNCLILSVTAAMQRWSLGTDCSRKKQKYENLFLVKTQISLHPFFALVHHDLDWSEDDSTTLNGAEEVTWALNINFFSEAFQWKSPGKSRMTNWNTAHVCTDSKKVFTAHVALASVTFLHHYRLATTWNAPSIAVPQRQECSQRSNGRHQ